MTHIPSCFDDGTRVCGFDEHPESVPDETCSLDAAWAEAEAALPEGGYISLTSNPTRSAYMAEAFRYFVASIPERVASTSGSTPAAALRALAAKLRGEA